VLRAGQVALSRFEKISQLLLRRKAVLDVGTGGGEFAYLLQALGHSVSGVEPNRGYADHSIRDYGLKVQVGFVQDAVFPPESFDVVTIWHVLEHTEDPGRVLALLRSWLKVDGILIVEVPNIESTCQAPKSTFHEAHLYNFNVLSLRRLAKKHGMHEAWHLISRDGGNITMFLTPIQPSLEGSYESAIPGNYEWVSRIVREHSDLRRHLTPLPYLRLWQRLYRSLMERRETAGATSGKALLDQLYSPQLRSYSVSQT
jgi:SAM-dependent methyltransferase